MHAIIRALSLMFMISACAHATSVQNTTSAPTATPTPEATQPAPQDPVSSCPGNNGITHEDPTPDIHSDGGGPTAQGS